MRIPFLLALLLLPSAALAQSDEDAAHRADRERTATLNRRAGHAVDRRQTANDAVLERYREAEAAYRRRLEAWRQRVAACEEGDDSACDPG